VLTPRSFLTAAATTTATMAATATAATATAATATAATATAATVAAAATATATVRPATSPGIGMIRNGRRPSWPAGFRGTMIFTRLIWGLHEKTPAAVFNVILLPVPDVSKAVYIHIEAGFDRRCRSGTPAKSQRQS
jgi:hypothetical protein